jgi:nanoRNase/pAp phosphatase (c-di-AMP/oligoRNAs hydrolase)
MTYNGSSDILNELVKRSPSGVAMGWFQRADGQFQTSLRSDGRVDVSVLAKKYGGGGHPKAAAFQGPALFSWERASS